LWRRATDEQENHTDPRADTPAAEMGSVQQRFIPCGAVVFVPDFLPTALRGVICRAKDKTLIVGMDKSQPVAVFLSHV